MYRYYTTDLLISSKENVTQQCLKEMQEQKITITWEINQALLLGMQKGEIFPKLQLHSLSRGKVIKENNKTADLNFHITFH